MEKNGFRLNTFFLPKTFVQSALTQVIGKRLKAFSQSASTTENVIDRARIERNMLEKIIKPVFLVE